MSTVERISELFRAQRVSIRDEAFFMSLLRFERARGALTPAQDAAAQRALARYDAPRAPQRAPDSAPRIDLSNVKRMLDAAFSAGLRRPTIRLARNLSLSRAPDTGRNPGAVYVKRSGNYIGKINADGSTCYMRDADVSEAERAEVIQFSAAPLERATVFGHATGRCCFCGRELTDARSVAMGYGPICAEHFGLEWGERRAAQSIEINAA